MTQLMDTGHKEIWVKDIFGNGQPVEIELGCGKGKFLLERAERSPDINFIGLDWAKKWLGIGEIRSQKKNLPNLTFFHTPAQEWVENLVPEQIGIFHIYFPDPWPKRRHHKRRLLQKPFLEVLYSRLLAEGCLQIATDHEGYREHIENIIQETSSLWKTVKRGNQRWNFTELQTHYEMKYAVQGRPLFYWELGKG